METIERPTVLPSMTFEEFLAWSSEDCRAEWVDGRIETLMPVSSVHNAITRFLIHMLEFFFETHLIATLYHGPYLMRLPTRPSGREPDIAIVLNEHDDRLAANYIDGPADIVVEVVSPESRDRDRIEKFREYARAGITEYWLIDPELHTAEFFTLRDGAYELAPIDADGRFRSGVLPEFWIYVPWVWERPTSAQIGAAWANAAKSE